MQLKLVTMLAAVALFACISITLGYPQQFAGEEGEEDDENVFDNSMRLVNNLERRGSWCARWGDYCVPDAKVKFADCCDGLRCVCGNLLWKPGQCQCKKPSMFGR